MFGSRFLALALLTAFACPCFSAEFVAVLDSKTDGSVKVSSSELDFFATELRKAAKSVLPDKFTVMTKANIYSLLPPEKEREECFADGCLVTIGKNIGAEYITQVIIGKFGNDYTLTAELYGVIGGNLISSITAKSQNLESLLAKLQKDAPSLFSKIPGAKKVEVSSNSSSEESGASGKDVASSGTCGNGFVFVKGGTFKMGCTTEGENGCQSGEKPVHQVKVSDFCIGKYEVTQKEWKNVMGNNPSSFQNCDDCPVESVSWNEIQEFTSNLRLKTDKEYRLPTEAEWEYAAKGGKEYEYSGSNYINDVARFSGNSGSKTHKVGTKRPNALGIYDMSGNVWEWVSDLYGNYSENSQVNPRGPKSGSGRVIRGGSWGSGARYCRVSNRGDDYPDYRNDILGFRLVYSP
ncbi:hypothetical protein AGMMS49938_17630 [Fibrobacterales bacterium]|nr:hypothetical protein AGMMS49938_17630 [Fibrobacterales bacterium]